MNYDRLLRLAAHLESLPNEGKQFNFRHWVGRSWMGDQTLSCGTTACAFGWAAAMPEFQALGLRLKKTYDGIGFVGLEGDTEDANEQLYRASAKVFGLTADEHHYLFTPSWADDSPNGRATAKQVAAHIRKVVANTQAKDPTYAATKVVEKIEQHKHDGDPAPSVFTDQKPRTKVTVAKTKEGR